MKRLFMITMLLLSISAVSWSQVTVGIRFSHLPVFQWISGYTSPPEANVEFGKFVTYFNAGGFLHFQLQEHWALQVEGIYSIGELPFSANYPNSPINSSYLISYLDFPILLQYEGKKPIRGFVQLGISPKVLALREPSSDFDFYRSDMVFGTVRDFKHTIAMGHIGGGVLFERRHWLFTADARFSASLNTIANYKPKYLVDMSTAHLYSFSISSAIGYKF
ncbi:porin family protein [Capnocytophaga sp. HP1101]